MTEEDIETVRTLKSQRNLTVGVIGIGNESSSCHRRTSIFLEDVLAGKGNSNNNNGGSITSSRRNDYARGRRKRSTYTNNKQRISPSPPSDYD
eukprot:1229303-Ditylum_brightwellii.AAC.1